MSGVTWPTWPPCRYMVKTLKIFFSRTNSPMALKLSMKRCVWESIKVVQIMTLGWPWPILRQGQIWSHRLLYGKNWKLFIFGNYWSLGSQSCLKHFAKCVNEVEWVSKVKVTLWPWSKVTQISKLKLVGQLGTKVHIEAWGRIDN